MCHVLTILHFLKCLHYSLFEDRVPYRDRQKAVNIVGNRAPLDKQEHSDHHCRTYTKPFQGMARNLHIQEEYQKCNLTRHSSFRNWVEGFYEGKERKSCPNLFEETRMPIEAGMSLQYY